MRAKTMKKREYCLRPILTALLVYCCGVAYSQPLYQERIYEPVVITGWDLWSLYNVPIPEIYLYSYHDNTQSWTMMPFQIDEKVLIRNPYANPDSPDSLRHSYFEPDTNPNFDYDDELVFLVRDLGDKAPARDWIDNEQAKTHNRLEIAISDPNDPDKMAYGYIFRSTTITEPVPAPYEFQYYPEQDSVVSKYYAVGMSHENGLIEDIVIKPPFGNGVDIFDTQKLRFIGLFEFNFSVSLGRGGKDTANERDNLTIYNESDGDLYYKRYTEKPIIRLIREVRQNVKFGIVTFPELAFYVKTIFYPFSGTVEGGAKLDSLQQEEGLADDIYVELDLLRQSWDFNSAASGMKFYNRYNSGISINGIPDVVDQTIDVPIHEWLLTTGAQGSFFTDIEFAQTQWDSRRLYFFDQKNGGQGDSTIIQGGDTGDGVSYGDQGILFHKLSQHNSVSLELGMTAYFLPGNLTRADGEKLAYQVENPAAFEVYTATGVADDRVNLPLEFALGQNYPNPFNPSTEILFGVPVKSQIKVAVYNLLGQQIAILTDQVYPPGTYRVRWDGRDAQGRELHSGVYFYRLTTAAGVLTRRMVLLR